MYILDFYVFFVLKYFLKEGVYMKRVLTIQDISCVGKCSLTVALPIISAFGVETAILPTAVLSTHTQFKEFTFRDLTDDIEPIYKHWKRENLSFDCIYTGYLGSKKQIDLVGDIFSAFKSKNNFTVVDPAMADNGVLYKGFDTEFARNMASLCGKADYILPNLTEASFMLGIPCVLEGYDEKYVKDLLVKLTKLGCKTAILTGIKLDGKNIGAYGYNSETKEYFSYYRKHLPVAFHGTGDIFSSAFAGALSLGKDVKTAIKIAVDFTWEAIDNTLKNPDHVNYGVEFETVFPSLMKMIK